MRFIKKTIKRWLLYILPASYVFMFHHVSDELESPKSGCVLNFERFKSFVLRYAGQNRYAALTDVVEKRKRGKIAITFDDGLADVYTLAYPFLKEANIPFTIFVISDLIDTDGYISTEQLIEMSKDSLVTIGSHGVSHEIFPNLSKEQKYYELYASKQKLQEMTGRNIRFFAYSHGQYDNETLDLVKMYDYAMSVRAVPLNLLTGSRYILPRFNVDATTVDAMQNRFDKYILCAKF